MLFAVVCLALLPCMLVADSGTVLPPTANPSGYSLTDMIKALGQFQASFNNLQYYPSTPFQILFVSQTQALPLSCDNGKKGVQVIGANSFIVSSATQFFVPLAFIDDALPVLGIFPTDPASAMDYFFGPSQYGAKDFQIIIDGEVTPIGPDYLAGPVQFTQPLIDGATAAIQLGAFVKQLPSGTHIITIRGEFAGAALFHIFKTNCILEDFTYIVRVIQSSN
jgi:hypothetical protein